MPLRRLVLDVLKPIKNPGIEELATRLESAKGVEGVNITVKEVDVETLTLMIVIEGDGIDLNDVKSKLEEFGAVIHSIDQVVSGKRTIEVPDFYKENL